MDERTPETGQDEQPATHLTAGPNAGAAQQLQELEDHLRLRVEATAELVSLHTANAAVMLSRGDYSTAAAEAHQAHQQRLIRDELRAALALIP